MNKITSSHLEKGVLLIASPEVKDEFYQKSVILLCEYTHVGSFGVILNKPLMQEIPENLKNIEELSHPSVRLRIGGIMQPGQMMLLHDFPRRKEETLEVTKEIFLGGDLTLLQEMLQEEKKPEILLCFGYTGWIGGELEKEFMSGKWLLYRSTKELIFHTPPEKLWKTALSQIGGKYASFALMPDDLSLN